ncbi:MAG: VOC family protein, partial [Pyrinomonadaceae bacterium]
MAKVTGIGGVFFKSAGKGAELGEWYKKNLGIELESWGGAILKWTDDEVKDGGLTVWNAADSDTKWF